ncbi:MAG: TPM domain-containing protein [Bacteroidota bacterium]|nr:TPM domain-containing protein [Flavisolibacter sp.]MBD0352257.1 TPM domain-containing protein [Flavisolibacter sp.]MDQ3845368.1 TPM domain-containing protein [Bacteroidota bacterium]
MAFRLFPWQKKKEFFTEDERARIVETVRLAEQRTSGEVRVYVENRCRFVDPLDRAKEIFYQLQMEKTEQRNGTLVYVAVKDRQTAVFGDEGIHQKVGQKYWEDEVNKMLLCFKQKSLVDGIIQCVSDIGEALNHHFPYDKDTDKNELPDDIVFGR